MIPSPDVTISVAQWAFALALLPAVWRRQAPPFLTCALTAAGMLAITVSQARLGLWYSVASASAGTLLWAILAAQTLGRK